MIELYLISVVVGFVIGFSTNWLAILALFRPRKRVLGFQGLLPRYKKELAEKIGKNVHIIMPESFKKSFKIPFVGKKIQEFFKNSVSEEIVKMDDKELEKIVRNVAGKELKFIEILGGLIGAGMGLIQAFMVSLLI